MATVTAQAAGVRSVTLPGEELPADPLLPGGTPPPTLPEPAPDLDPAPGGPPLIPDLPKEPEPVG